jgi:hypothetical protein
VQFQIRTCTCTRWVLGYLRGLLIAFFTLSSNKPFHESIAKLLVQNRYYSILLIFVQNKEWTKFRIGFQVQVEPVGPILHSVTARFGFCGLKLKLSSLTKQHREYIFMGSFGLDI